MMDATHTILVTVYAGGELVKTGSTIDYDGPPNWKFRPDDPLERAQWEANTADWNRVEATLRRSGEWDSEVPAGLIPGRGEA